MREHRKMTLKTDRNRNFMHGVCVVYACSARGICRGKTESGSQVSKRELAYIQISVGDGQETPVFKGGAEGIRVSDQCKTTEM